MEYSDDKAETISPSTSITQSTIHAGSSKVNNNDTNLQSLIASSASPSLPQLPTWRPAMLCQQRPCTMLTAIMDTITSTHIPTPTHRADQPPIRGQQDTKDRPAACIPPPSPNQASNTIPFMTTNINMVQVVITAITPTNHRPWDTRLPPIAIVYLDNNNSRDTHTIHTSYQKLIPTTHRQTQSMLQDMITDTTTNTPRRLSNRDRNSQPLSYHIHEDGPYCTQSWQRRTLGESFTS